MFNQNFTKKGLFYAVSMLIPALSVMGATSPYEHRMQQNQNSSMNNSSYSQQEQQFSAQLSDLHRQIFLNEFNPMQRAEAMALYETEQNKRFGKSMSADMAVEEVLKTQRGQSQRAMTQKNNSRYKDSTKYSGRSKNMPEHDYDSDEMQSNKRQGYSYTDDDDSDQGSSKSWWQSENKQQKPASQKQRRQSGYWD